MTIYSCDAKGLPRGEIPKSCGSEKILFEISDLFPYYENFALKDEAIKEFVESI